MSIKTRKLIRAASALSVLTRAGMLAAVLVAGGSAAYGSIVVSFTGGSNPGAGPNPGTSPTTSLTFNNIASSGINLLLTASNDYDPATCPNPLLGTCTHVSPDQNFVFYGTDTDGMTGSLGDVPGCGDGMTVAFHCTGIGAASSNMAGEPSVAQEGKGKYDSVIFSFSGSGSPIANTFQLGLVGYTSDGQDSVLVFLNGVALGTAVVTGTSTGAFIDFSQFALAPNTSINSLAIAAGGCNAAGTTCANTTDFLIGGFTFDVAAPEPSSYSFMIVAGLAGLIAAKLRRKSG